MNDPMYVMAVVFKSYVETRTGGRHVVEIYPSNVLGKERERLELVKAGGIQVNVGSIGGLSALYKPGILLNTPFMYSSDKVVHAVLESDFVKWLFEDFYEKTGIRSYMIFDGGGLSCFTNNVRPITKVADMKGIKFRAMDDSQIAMFRALGANAIPMAFAELYTGLQTGVVEGQVNPISITISSKFYEVQKYISISRTILGSQWITINEKWYESLSPEDKKIFDDAFFYANIAAKGQSQIVQAVGLKMLEDYKMQVSDIRLEDYKEFQQLGRTAVLDWCKTQMEPEIVDRFIAAVEEIENKLQ
jgi:tripartite ATP-independent transporter DctP family solute receptor